MMRPLFVLTVVLGLAGCDTMSKLMPGSSSSGPDPAELVDFEVQADIQSLWSRDIGSGATQGLRPAGSGDRVFAAGRDGEVAAYQAESGEPAWQIDLDQPVSGGVGSGDGLVLVGTREADVIAMDEDNGEVRWRTRVSSVVMAPPKASDGVVVVRTVDGKLYGLDSGTGSQLWVFSQTVPVLTLRGTSTPVIAGDGVLSGFDGGRLVALSLRDGKTFWNARVSIPKGRSDLERIVDIDSEPQVIEDSVYVVTYQGQIAAMDLFSGRVHWKREMSSYAGIAADARHVYVTDAEGLIWALDRFSSASVWRRDELKHRGVTAPVVVGNYVVVGDYQGYIHWMDRESGEFVARTRVDSSGISSPPLAHQGVLYAYGNGGNLQALRPPK